MGVSPSKIEIVSTETNKRDLAKIKLTTINNFEKFFNYSAIRNINNLLKPLFNNYYTNDKTILKYFYQANEIIDPLKLHQIKPHPDVIGISPFFKRRTIFQTKAGWVFIKNTNKTLLNQTFTINSLKLVFMERRNEGASNDKKTNT